MRRGFAVAALVVGACAAPPPIQARLQPWVGRGEGDLVAAFGVPVRTYAADDRKFLEFEERRARLVPADPLFYRAYPYGPFWAAPAFPATVQVVCSVTFALRRGAVEAFTFRGDGCR